MASGRGVASKKAGQIEAAVYTQKKQANFFKEHIARPYLYTYVPNNHSYDQYVCY